MTPLRRMTDAGAALLLAAVLLPAAAQLIVQPSDSSCPTNQLFLGSFDDDHIAFAPLSGLYRGEADSGGSGPVTRYRHELGRALLRRHTSQKTSSAVWYVQADGAPTPGQPALPAAGRVFPDDPSSPTAHIRSAPSAADQQPWQAAWQVWTPTGWQALSGSLPGGNASADCAGLLKVRCVDRAWRCPAGRLVVTGMAVGAETDAAPAQVTGRLVGADQPAFSKELVGADDAVEVVDAPFPAMTAGSEPDGMRLGTFLLTDATHVNRPVYRHARPGSATFLYFDRLRAADGTRLPVWIVGPEPGRVDLTKSRLFAAVDAARRPEEITGCWLYLAAGRQLPARLNATCEHGRRPARPDAGADCDFELPGGCGYRATNGSLRQVPYSAEQQRLARAAGDAAPGAFLAELTAVGSQAAAESLPFSPATNSCVALQYRMRTDDFFGTKFSVVSEADGALRVLHTMFSAERDWTRVTAALPAGRYRLRAHTTDLAAGDALQLDSVRVTPGKCDSTDGDSPCHHSTCQNGGTCVPTDDTSYTCLCPPEHHGRSCRAMPPCPPPPQVKYARALAVPAAGDALQTAAYQCQADFELREPAVRSVATCAGGVWRGVPACQRGGGAPAEVGPGGGATGPGSPAARAAVAALAAAVTFTAARLLS